MALFSDQLHGARRLRFLRRLRLLGRGGTPLALVDQLTIDLGADGHLDQLVLDVSYDPGPRAEFDAFRRLDVALHGAVQPHVGCRHDALDAAALADRQHAAVVAGRDDVAPDVPVDVQAPLELDVALDSCLRADQRAGGRLPALFTSEHRRSFLLVVAARGRPIERLHQRLAARLARPHLDLDRHRLEADRQHELLLEPLEVAESVLELRDLVVTADLGEIELLRRTVSSSGDAQSYNAFDPAVLRDRLHQHDPHDEAPLVDAGLDLDALHPQTRLAVGRLDDAAVERELLLLRLKLRFERRQRALDAGVRLPIDVP